MAEVKIGDIVHHIQSMEQVKKDHALKTLELLGYDKTKTAEALGITPKSLYNWLDAWGITPPKRVQLKSEPNVLRGTKDLMGSGEGTIL